LFDEALERNPASALLQAGGAPLNWTRVAPRTSAASHSAGVKRRLTAQIDELGHRAR